MLLLKDLTGEWGLLRPARSVPVAILTSALLGALLFVALYP